jgi:hypothetical protein
LLTVDVAVAGDQLQRAVHVVQHHPDLTAARHVEIADHVEGEAVGKADAGCVLSMFEISSN